MRRLVLFAGVLSLTFGCSTGRSHHRPAAGLEFSTTTVSPDLEANAQSTTTVTAGSAVRQTPTPPAAPQAGPQWSLPMFTGQLPGPPFYVAQATVAFVPVYDRPGASTPQLSLSSPNEDGAPRVFLVVVQQPGWLQVLLPVRPNGTVGWIHSGDVTVAQHDYHILVQLGGHRITVSKGRAIVDQEPVGIGTANSPTPGGIYFVTEVLQAPDPSGPYGPYALGLSGYSNVYQSFNGGNGAIGIHGTNDPSAIGRDVSHGCVRMSNAGVTMLAHTLPLGTPVFISA